MQTFVQLAMRIVVLVAVVDCLTEAADCEALAGYSEN
jgi:hypothetical protein